MYYTVRKKRKGKTILIVIIFVFLLFAIYYISGIGFHPIKISLPKNSYIGKNGYWASITDNKAAIKTIKITITNALTSRTIFEKNFADNRNRRLIKFKIPSDIADGSATITIFARDKSIRHFLQGTTKTKRKKVIVDKTAPKIGIYGLPIRIDKGGLGLPIWNVEDKFPNKTWVNVDGYSFPGYNAKSIFGKGNIFSTFITWPIYSNAPIGNATISATDLAGNKTTVHLPVYWKQKSFRKTSINVTSLTLEKAKQASGGKSFANNKDLFLYVNRKLRMIDNSKITKICSQSKNVFFLHKRFIQLPHSAVTSKFADIRSYFMKRQLIDKQMHLGYDLASTSHSKVPAAADGIVKFTGTLYLYGNIVIIDHGFGLFSLYAHLSKINVKKGTKVKRGDIIGITGQTGMAGGDHLHFGIYVSGIPTNPIYLWDKRWISSHIIKRIQSAKLEIM